MAGWDAFQFLLCLKHLGKIMYAVVLTVVGVSWYSVCWSAGMLIAQGGLAGLLSLVGVLLFNFLIGMLLWSYFACSLTVPGHVPPHWSPFPDPEEWKPERAHHCSMTGRCVLRMDHYCLWVLNAVGLLNYKAFLLFLGYTMLAAMLATGLLLRSFIDFFQEGDIQDVARAIILFVAFVLDAAFSLSLCGFLIMHGRMVAQNRTTIETFEKVYVSPWPYDKGWRHNLEEVFGVDQRRWWLPTHSKQQTQLMLEQALSPAAAEEQHLQLPVGQLPV